MKKWNSEDIKKLRHHHNLSQVEFAKLLGCRQQTVSEWETQIYKPGNAYQRILSDIEKSLHATKDGKQ